MNTLLFPLTTAICGSPCGTNKQCTAPDTCTCVSGWSGNDCLTGLLLRHMLIQYISKIFNNHDTSIRCTAIILLTIDINECSQNICQVQCTNTNGSYYCSCDTSSVLATDGIHCLGKLLDV